MTNPIIDAIIKRRSVRSFTEEPLEAADIEVLLEAGRWAPSGLNNQPWRFVVIEDKVKIAEIAELTHYKKVVAASRACIAVFLDEAACYNKHKDAQSAGACIQNMLLAAHSLGLGAVWLGEILKNNDKVRDCLGLDASMELQAVIAIGRPARQERKSERRPISDLVLARY